MKTLARFVIALLFLSWLSAVGEFPWQLRAAQFTLNWSDNSDNEAGFRIERSSDGENYLILATVGENVESYIDAGLPNSTTYWYRLRAYNSAGNSAYSNVASATTPPPLPAVPAGPGATLILKLPGFLTNISTRAGITDADPVIGGFVVAQGDAVVLIRGIGPTLAGYGVKDPCPDPQIQLIGGPSNDNWSGEDIAAAARMAGAFALPVGSKDAALLVTLPPGVYTVHLTGVAGATGTGLVEIYDLTPRPPTP